jgi:hypothetical protein
MPRVAGLFLLFISPAPPKGEPRALPDFDQAPASPNLARTCHQPLIARRVLHGSNGGQFLSHQTIEKRLLRSVGGDDLCGSDRPDRRPPTSCAMCAEMLLLLQRFLPPLLGSVFTGRGKVELGSLSSTKILVFPTPNRLLTCWMSIRKSSGTSGTSFICDAPFFKSR